jgi:hypothetical protein
VCSFIEIECEVRKRKVYVIIFSIDKNYELYQELEEGRKMVEISVEKTLCEEA